MIISNKHKFICLNAPKTGSGFREKHLNKHADIHNGMSQYADIRHYNVNEANTFMVQNDFNPEDYFWFTFTRNPWRLIESYYNMNGNNYCINNGRSLDDYINTIYFKRFVINRLDKLMSVNNYITRNNKPLDFIGSLENIDEDLKFISEKFNLNLDINKYNDVYKYNFKEIIKERKLWTEELVNIVADHYNYIIELKQYKFSE
tara:strand:+ start:140 stop:748 length:609 start_codon:yes stop_codon:yes gene_type:complete